MFDSFKRYISNKAKLTNQELDKIQSLSIEKKFRKKQYLLQTGDICKHHTFIVKGCMRLYRISNKGVEHIIRFAIEEWWMGDKESLNTGQPSRSNIDALEDSEVLMWTKENHQILLDEIPAFNVFSERVQARSLASSYNRIYTTISLSAEEKYHDFIQTYPNIFNRVPLHMIASYLGVSRETLSRIRNQFTSK